MGNADAVKGWLASSEQIRTSGSRRAFVTKLQKVQQEAEKIFYCPWHTEVLQRPTQARIVWGQRGLNGTWGNLWVVFKAQKSNIAEHMAEKIHSLCAASQTLLHVIMNKYFVVYRMIYMYNKFDWDRLEQTPCHTVKVQSGKDETRKRSKGDTW